MNMVIENLTKVRGRIREAALRVGRDPHSVTLVAVTKQAEIDGVREAIEFGVTDIGENRVKDAAQKRELLDSHILNWHMIGHLQSKKAKDAVRIFSVIHSVDTLKLACAIDKEAGKSGKVQDILIEVNVSGEKSKFGIAPGALGGFLKEAGHLKNINIAGVMTMAPFTDDAGRARPCFRELKKLADAHNLKEISMGMTQDFEVAVEEGATMVRIGSAIFRGES